MDIEELHADSILVSRFPAVTSRKLDALARFKHLNKNFMLEFAFFFFILALLAALLGFFGLVGPAALIAKILCVAFMALFVIATLLHRPRP